jgi:hypothetical protein
MSLSNREEYRKFLDTQRIQTKDRLISQKRIYQNEYKSHANLWISIFAVTIMTGIFLVKSGLISINDINLGHAFLSRQGKSTPFAEKDQTPTDTMPNNSNKSTPQTNSNEAIINKNTIYKWIDDRKHTHYTNIDKPSNANPILTYNPVLEINPKHEEMPQTRYNMFENSLANDGVLKKERERQEECKFWKDNALRYDIETLSVNVRKFCH